MNFFDFAPKNDVQHTLDISLYKEIQHRQKLKQQKLPIENKHDRRLFVDIWRTHLNILQKRKLNTQKDTSHIIAQRDPALSKIQATKSAIREQTRETTFCRNRKDPLKLFRQKLTLNTQRHTSHILAQRDPILSKI